MKLIPVSENITHAPREFFSEAEIEILESGADCLRVMPIPQGGQLFTIKRGGLYYATIQEVAPQ